MDPFEKVVRQLLDNLEARYKEAITQSDHRRKELVFDIIMDLKKISKNVLEDQRN